jgi:LysM repeat protein
MHAGLTRSLFAVAAAAALLGVAACADPDDSSSSATTAVALSSADTATIPPTSSTAPPQPGDAVQTELDYTIVSGDYLSSIASRFSVKLDELVAYNDWTDGVNHPLYPGDIIKIPPGYKIPSETTTTTAAPEAGGSDTTEAGSDDGESTSSTQTTIDTSAGGSYTVVANDYLGGIAKKVGSTVDAIVAANGWSDGSSHVLIPGDVIKIP